MSQGRKIRLLATALLGFGMLAGCETPRRKSDSELGLTPQQARGRSLYDAHCLRCHEAYTSGGRHGPTMRGLYKKPEMPSGTPVNDERLAEVVLYGRAKMPGFRNQISGRELEDLIAYMKTL